MTEHSQNGWTASPGLVCRSFVVDGITFPPGIRDDDDVETVLRHVVEQFAARVEPLAAPGCWGFSYRANRNDPDSLSNHASGTAVDVNAPKHPNGVATRKTFTVEQVVEIHRILLEVRSAVRWGGDYQGTPDAMHFEVNVDAATLHGVAEELRGGTVTPEDIEATAKRAAELVLNAKVGNDDATVKQVLNRFKTWLERQ